MIVKRNKNREAIVSMLRAYNEYGINAVMGGALGLVKGALLLFFAVWLLRRLQLWITPELISQTYILRFFAEHSPMELITSL